MAQDRPAGECHALASLYVAGWNAGVVDGADYRGLLAFDPRDPRERYTAWQRGHRAGWWAVRAGIVAMDPPPDVPCLHVPYDPDDPPCETETDAS